MEYRFDLHLGEVQTNALVSPAAKRHPGIRMDLVFPACFAEPLWVKGFRFRPELFHIVGKEWADADPYVEAGVYQNVTVKPYKKVLP